MPLYEYICHDCDIKFEALRPMSKANETIHCKNCESLNTARVLSLFATIGSKSSAEANSNHGGHSCGGNCGNCGSGSCGHH